MISQADIIRSLVNKNCTDEAIMSTALSPGCTLPKLLQKFTEAERFDLALDVYMKLGMDVGPLWKTWAMRCLRSRDFQGAREKFRHCFQRSRSSTGRFGAATSVLLADILRELVRMNETKLPLSAEIDSILNRRGRNVSPQRVAGVGFPPTVGPCATINETKPKIFNECLYYLKEFGTSELLIKFYVDNELWPEALETLIATRDARDNDDAFFVASVVAPSETTGHLSHVIDRLLELDPQIDRTSSYFRALYDHLSRRHHTLYYVQHRVGDYVRAAENQVQNFFLKRPMHNYKELNLRLPSLISARDEYNRHLETLEVGPPASRRLELSTFTSELAREATQLRLKIIDTQIEITRNFAINEVTGCMGDIEVVFRSEGGPGVAGEPRGDRHSPVTLFDSCPRRRTFLAALILTYFDLDCANYISDSGFELADKLVDECQLDKLSVFKTAMNIIIDDESSDIIENASLLLKRLRADYMACSRRAKLKRSSPANEPKREAKPVTGGQVSSANSVSKNVISRPRKSENPAGSRQETRASGTSSSSSSSSSQSPANSTRKRAYHFEPPEKSVRPGSDEAARLLCDQVIQDAIKSCREEDYKMELIKLLSPEAKVVHYIELGKLSVAQRLAFDMQQPECVKMVLREAEKLNQDHVRDVCRHWLAKH